MRNLISIFFILISLFFFGCDETPDLTDILSSSPAEVTELTDEVWEILRMYREADLIDAENYKKRYFAEWGDEDESRLQKLRERADQLKSDQELYYNRYIDAAGVAIIGNAEVSDEVFHQARSVTLIMSARRPEAFTDTNRKTFHIIVGGTDSAIENESRFRKLPENRYDSRNISGKTGNRSYIAHGMHYNDRIEVAMAVSKIRTGHDYLMSTFVHETAHIISYYMLDYYGYDKFREIELHAAQNAIDKGLWSYDSFGRYFGSGYSPHEFWAGSVTAWYYEICEDGRFKTVEEFIEYDDVIGELISAWFMHVSLYDFL